MRISSQISNAEAFGFYSKKLREAQEENIALRNKLAAYERIIETLKERLNELTKA